MTKVIIRTIVRPYSNKELALLYNTSGSSYRREMVKIRHHLGVRIGHRWNIHQVTKIFELLTPPYETIEIEEDTILDLEHLQYPTTFKKAG